MKVIFSFIPNKNHCYWLLSLGTAAPPVNPTAPHTYQQGRTPYGPPPTEPPAAKPTPPPTGLPVASATPPPPNADGKFVCFFLLFFFILSCPIYLLNHFEYDNFQWLIHFESP